jgi:DNA-binding LacI/PurR family transcriptional regulator
VLIEAPSQSGIIYVYYRVGIVMGSERHTWGQTKNVTLDDVAREARVSQSAASVVLNGAKSGTGVSAERRLRIIEAAERLGYQPNALARSLITGRTNLIGVYSGRSILDSRNSFFAALLGGCFEGCRPFRANTVVHSTGHDQEALLTLVSNRLLDGLVVQADDQDPILRLLGEFRVPAVAVADVVAGLPNVCVDDVAGGMLQAHHLAKLGHRSVLLKTSPGKPNSAVQRSESFKQTATGLGVRVHERYETFAPQDALDLDDIRLITREADRVTAIVAWSDHLAQRICNKLDLLGLKIPGDVAVIGFDGFEPPYIPRYRLTTVRAPWAEVGKTAIRLLIELVEGRSAPNLTVLPVEFVRGETT